MLNEIRRHVILVSGTASDSKSVAAIMSLMRMTGAIPMLVAEHQTRLNGETNDECISKLVAADLANADGVIVMGNDLDIDPADYNETKIHPKTNSEKSSEQSRLRGAYEYELLRQTLNGKLPCLTVCGGMQRLNVLLGGSLHQHVPDLTGTHYHQQGALGIAPFIPVQYVTVLPGTKLADISEELGGLFTPQQDDLPPGIFMENSFHHQAVNKVGAGLIPCAYTIDADNMQTQIVQAIEADPNGPYKDQFILGVQWHPEFGASDVSIRSLQNFNEQVQASARNNPKNINMTQVLANSFITGRKIAAKTNFSSSIVSSSFKPKPGKGR